MKRLLLILLFLFPIAVCAQPAMTVAEVYDYNIGDIFITEGSTSPLPPIYRRITITNKYYSSLLDSVYYVYDYHSYVPCGPPPCNPTIHDYYGLLMSYTNLNDTIGAGLGAKPVLINGGPCIDTTGFTGTWFDTTFYDSQFCNVLTTRIHWVNNGPDFIDTCIQCFECWPGYRDYGKGVGEKYYIYDQCASGGPYCVSVSELIWYKKGTDSCGTYPIELDIEKLYDENPAFFISPNPAHDKLNVESNLLNAEVKIYDMMGREMLSREIRNWKLEIGVEFSPGVYLVKVSDGKQQAVQKLIIE
jgi:hypothetical protein